MKFSKFTFITLLASLLLSGCSFVDEWVYRPDINQGNYVTQENINKLKIGQTKEQVQFIMGSPMLSSIFSDNIWYYVFRQQPRHDIVSQKTFAIIFNTAGRVTDIKISELGKSISLDQMSKLGNSDKIESASESESN